MKIAVLGGGAMGSLYGGYLSRRHDVLIVDVNEALVQKINGEGLLIHEPDGSSALYHPRAAVRTEGETPADLVIVFVKSLFSRSALTANRSLIGPDTLLMTLQNGSGHEQTLLDFVDREHVVIGTTPFADHTSGARPGNVSSFLSSIQRSSTGGCHPEKFFGVGLFHDHTSFAETTSGRFSLRANHHSICIAERPKPQSE